MVELRASGPPFSYAQLIHLAFCCTDRGPYSARIQRQITEFDVVSLLLLSIGYLQKFEVQLFVNKLSFIFLQTRLVHMSTPLLAVAGRHVSAARNAW